MATFSCNPLTGISNGHVVIKGLMIWGSKCHQNNSPVVCNGYLKYEEAEVDRLVAILKTNNCGDGPCGIQLAARLGEGCIMIHRPRDKITDPSSKIWCCVSASSDTLTLTVRGST